MSTLEKLKSDHAAAYAAKLFAHAEADAAYDVAEAAAYAANAAAYDEADAAADAAYADTNAAYDAELEKTKETK